MSSINFPIQLVNGQQIVDMQNITGYHQIMLGFTQYPSAGRMAIEFKPVGIEGWFPVPEASALNLTAPRYAVAFGAIDKLRFTLSGLSGGAGLVCEIVTTAEWPGVGFPAGLFEGQRAITVQNYTEANVKNGVQFTAATYFTGLTAGEVIDVIVVTGAKKVLLKAQALTLKNGGDILLDWYRSPTYTGGSNISAGIYNQSDVAPVASTVQLFGPTPTNAATGDYSPNDATKPNVTSVGTKVFPTLAVLGTSGIGGSAQSRASAEGLEQVLQANTTYLFRRTFIAATESMFGVSTWFEGEPDFPRS